jgi:L-threonylcarbamoyladenylate synthase
MNLYTVSDKKFSTDVVFELCTTLKEGSVSVLPFDTCYGLVGDAFSQKAVDKISRIKSRVKVGDEFVDGDNSRIYKQFSVFVSDVGDITKFGELSSKAKDFVMMYMPGSVTLVVPIKEGVDLPCSSNGFVGIRLLKDGFLNSVAANFGGPLITTSANLSGEGPFCNLPEVLNSIGHDADLASVVDGDAIDSDYASTVVKIVGDEVEILRQGVVRVDM